MQDIVFFGSSPFSIIVLEKVLSAKCKVLSVVTNSDKPAGRHLRLTPNPVKVFAQKNDIPVIENITPFPPLTTKARAESENLRGGTEEGDIVGLVAAYGKIIPKEILDKFNGHIYNIHPSLLPKYRGASPLQQQILDGVSDTGVTIIQMDEKMDHGPIVAVQKDTILPTDTWITLGNRLFELGADLFLSLALSTSHLALKEQDDSLATYTHKLTRQDGFIDYKQLKDYLELRVSNLEIERKLRAFSGWPGIWSIDPKGQRIKP